MDPSETFRPSVEVFRQVKSLDDYSPLEQEYRLRYYKWNGDCYGWVFVCDILSISLCHYVYITQYGMQQNIHIGVKLNLYTQ